MVRTRHHPGTLRDKGDSPDEFLSLESKASRRLPKQTEDDYNSDDSGVVPASRRGRSSVEQPMFQSRLRPKIRSSGAYFIGDGLSSDEDADSPTRSRSSSRKLKRRKSPGSGRKSKGESSIEIDYHDEEVDPEDDHDDENGCRRRSTRTRKMTYDTLNQSFLDKAVVSAKDEHDENQNQNHSGRNKRKSDNIEGSDKFSDMYSRVKRQRQHIQKDMYGVPVHESDSSSTSESEDDEQDVDGDEDGNRNRNNDKPQKRSYYLREHKPRTQLFEAPPIESQKKKTPSMFRGETPPRSTRRLDSHQTYRSPAHKKKVVRKRAAFHVSSSTSEECLSSDEERFQRRKAKSMARSRARCLPMNFKPEDLENGVRKERMKLGASLADIDPMAIDRSVNFNSIGGLGKHIRALKEMIVFPIMYPEIFERFNIAPPRGVLFHGPPGTGKTLVARALANECSTGNKKVAFFMRKGADCLSKWVGESERQLRLLFDQAYQVRPAIIFFDEIDGLAPVRSSRQDQIHSSIVSTLLALMDGLDSRGEIVVIGATNRIDSIDPALRRPGRFDREFLFPLPSEDARKHILKIHTKAWNPKLSDQFVTEVAKKCVGYCGADLKALCTEAALQASRRRYPQIYTSNEKLQLNVSSIHISAKDFFKGMQAIVPTSQRSVGTPSRALSHALEPLLKKQFQESLVMLHEVFPSILAKLASLDAPETSGDSQPGAVTLDEMASDDDEEGPSIYDKGRNSKRSSVDAQPDYLCFSRQSYQCPTTYRPRMLLCGIRGQGQTSHIGPAIVHHMEQLPVHVLDLPTVYAATAKTPEESCAQVFHEAKRTAPSIVYMPYINQWWEVLNDTLRATFLTLIQNLDPSTPILILATSESPYEDIDSLLKILFSNNAGEVKEMRDPTSEERREYFRDLLLNQAVRPPTVKKQAGLAKLHTLRNKLRQRSPTLTPNEVKLALRILEVLPKAPPPQPPKLTEAEVKKLHHQEEATLRELRIFLRDVLNKLGRDRKFGIFTKPVDAEDAPDYYEIIQKPMDLSTMMSKIDLHQYQTVAEFLDDINQICLNALEYNPDRIPSDRAIRHRACALRDTAQAIIETELDPDFEKQCQNVQDSRSKRGIVRQKSVPTFYFTKPAQNNPQQEGTIAKPLPPTPMGVRCSRRVRGKEAEDIVPLEIVEKQLQMEKRLIKENETTPSQNKDSPVQTKRQQNETPSSAKHSHTPQSSGKKSKPKKKCIWAGTKRRRRKKPQKALLTMDNLEEEVSEDSDSEIVIAESPRRDTHDLGSSQPSSSGHDSGMGSSVDSNGDSVDSVEHAREKDRKNQEHSPATILVDLAAEDASPDQGGKIRMTRSRLSTKEQQQALDLLEETLPALVVDVARLQRLLDKTVIVTCTYNLERLEKLYSVFSQCIYRHRRSYDKTKLTEELESKLDQHCKPIATS